MDNQYKLTDKVTKDSIKSPIFKKWVKRILCIACILSLALQLTLCCMPMNVSAADNDSVIGTWVFNDFVNLPKDAINYNIDFTYSNSSVVCKRIRLAIYSIYYYNYSNSEITAYSSFNSPPFQNVSYKTIIITGGSDVNNSDFYVWLNANATKVVEVVYDFTGETRIFNDELTLFNTSEATFTNSFNFSFDVLGVGTADYITLQRTVQNNYTMSYAFDFDDSGGLTMIYRDSPPFNNGEAEWLGGLALYLRYH